MTQPLTQAITLDPRAKLIAGMRALADFFEQHPDVPTPPGGDDISYCVPMDDDDEGVAEVARIAAMLGVEPRRTGGGSRARREFGGMEYRVFHVSQEAYAAHLAHYSYSGSVVPADTNTESAVTR